LALAKELLKKGGVARGFRTTLLTEQFQEIPAFAQILKTAAAKIGVNIDLRVETETKYFGKATIGNSDWLDGTMSYVAYGARGVPNLFLQAPLQSVNAKTSQGPGTRRASTTRHMTSCRSSSLRRRTSPASEGWRNRSSYSSSTRRPSSTR